MQRYLLTTLFLIVHSITFAQYTPTSPYLLNPELAIGYTDSCANFWLQTWDSSIGGFFTNIDKFGNVITGWGTNKNMLRNKPLFQAEHNAGRKLFCLQLDL